MLTYKRPGPRVITVSGELYLSFCLSLEKDRERDRRALRPPPSRLLPASFSPPLASAQLESNRSCVSMANAMANRARCCPWLRPWATSSVQTTALSIASFLIDGRVCEFSLVSLAAFVRAGSAESRGRKLVCRVVLLRAHSPGKCRCFALICLTDQLQNYGVLVRARPFVLFASSTRLVGRSIRRLVGRRGRIVKSVGRLAVACRHRVASILACLASRFQLGVRCLASSVLVVVCLARRLTSLAMNLIIPWSCMVAD